MVKFQSSHLKSVVKKKKTPKEQSSSSIFYENNWGANRWKFERSDGY